MRCGRRRSKKKKQEEGVAVEEKLCSNDGWD